MSLRKMFLGFCAWLAFSSLAAGQTKPAWTARPKVEIFGSVAVAHIFRAGDRGLGTKANAGAGVEVPIWRGLRAGAEVNRTCGLAPTPVKCGSIYPGPGQPAYPCTGSAREGVGAAMAASFTAAWFFGGGRSQPYVFGGLSILRTQQFTSVSIVRTDHVEFQEISSRDTGAGLTFGIGLRAPLTRRLSIRPEFRFSDGTAMSRANLSQVRFSVGLGYGWE